MNSNILSLSGLAFGGGLKPLWAVEQDGIRVVDAIIDMFLVGEGVYPI
jgi:hypothetical protein